MMLVATTTLSLALALQAPAAPQLSTRPLLSAHRNVAVFMQVEEEAMSEELRAEVMLALETAEKKPTPELDTLFEDVYKEVPKHLQEQKAEMEAHIAKYPSDYTVGHH